MSLSLLSVVMPTHNRPEQLLRAARSVLDQQVSAIELVIVDDASSDATPEMTARLAEDPRVTVIRNEQSLGPGGARNKGIAATSGELLGFCDDDDAWLPGAASILLGALEADPELGVVSSWHRVVHDTTGREVDYRGPTHFDASDLLWFNFVALPFGIIRRELFTSELTFDPALPPCEDWDRWLRCAFERPIEVVPHVLYSYHQHGGERVTKVGSGSRGGREVFLDKHSSVMTSACRDYHEAVIADQEHGRGAMANSLAKRAASDPIGSAFASSVLAACSATSSVAVRRRDPGMTARMLRTMLQSGPARAHLPRTG